MALIKNTFLINLIVIILIIFTIHLTYGLPIFKIFNSINIRNVVNFESINENNNEKNNKNNNEKNIEKYNNFDIINVILDNNYTINATVTKHSLIYNPTTTYFSGEVILSYNNNFDKHYYCKININPENHKSSKDIQNYIYYEFNLSKLINLTCNNEKCIFKTYYKYQYNFNYFICDIKYNYLINDEL